VLGSSPNASAIGAQGTLIGALIVLLQKRVSIVARDWKSGPSVAKRCCCISGGRWSP